MRRLPFSCVRIEDSWPATWWAKGAAMGGRTESSGIGKVADGVFGQRNKSNFEGDDVS